MPAGHAWRSLQPREEKIARVKNLGVTQIKKRININSFFRGGWPTGWGCLGFYPSLCRSFFFPNLFALYTFLSLSLSLSVSTSFSLTRGNTFSTLFFSPFQWSFIGPPRPANDTLRFLIPPQPEQSTNTKLASTEHPSLPFSSTFFFRDFCFLRYARYTTDVYRPARVTHHSETTKVAGELYFDVLLASLVLEFVFVGSFWVTRVFWRTVDRHFCKYWRNKFYFSVNVEKE